MPIGTQGNFGNGREQGVSALSSVREMSYQPISFTGALQTFAPRALAINWAPRQMPKIRFPLWIASLIKRSSCLRKGVLILFIDIHRSTQKDDMGEIIQLWKTVVQFKVKNPVWNVFLSQTGLCYSRPLNINMLHNE